MRQAQFLGLNDAKRWSRSSVNRGLAILLRIPMQLSYLPQEGKWQNEHLFRWLNSIGLQDYPLFYIYDVQK